MATELLREEGVRFPTEQLKKEFWNYNADFLQEVAMVYLEHQHNFLESFPKGIDEDARANKILSAFRLGFGEAEKRIITGGSKAGINKNRPNPPIKPKGQERGKNKRGLEGIKMSQTPGKLGSRPQVGTNI